MVLRSPLAATGGGREGQWRGGLERKGNVGTLLSGD